MNVPLAHENSEPTQFRPRFPDPGYLFIAIVGTILTLATGWFSSTVLYSPGGFITQGYGFPFAWKQVDASCPPPCIQANGTFYDWFAFAGDLVFFMAATFAIFYYLLPKSRPLQEWLSSRKLLGLLTLLVIALAAGNYAYDSVYGTGNHWTGYGRVQLDHYSFQNLNMLTLWIIDTGPGNVTLTNLSITDGVGTRASFLISVLINQNTVAQRCREYDQPRTAPDTERCLYCGNYQFTERPDNIHSNLDMSRKANYRPIRCSDARAFWS